MGTKEQLYVVQRERWQLEKPRLLGLVEYYEDEAEIHRKRIESERPKTAHGEYVCPESDCDCFSMAPISRESKIRKGKKIEIVESICEICGYGEKLAQNSI